MARVAVGRWGVAAESGGNAVPLGRGLHSSTFQLNVSALGGTMGIAGMFRECLRRGWSGCLLVGIQGMCCMPETAQVELRSGRV